MFLRVTEWSVCKMENIKDIIEKLDRDLTGYIAEELKNVQPDIEAMPSVALIKELLGEVPAQIDMIRTKAIQVKKVMMDYKVFIKDAKQRMEIKKSLIRKRELDEYQLKMKDFTIEGRNMISDISSGNKKLPTAMVQELLKTIRPEKPTQNYLDDLANLNTQQEQAEIIKYEKTYNALEEKYSLLESLAMKYENKNIAVRAHKALMEAEMRFNV